MPEYDNRNSGVLFKNERKTQDNHPDYNGTFVDANNEERDLSAWLKKSKTTGKTFMSVKVGRPTSEWKNKGKQQQAPQREPEPKEEKDDLPF